VSSSQLAALGSRALQTRTLTLTLTLTLVRKDAKGRGRGREVSLSFVGVALPAGSSIKRQASLCFAEL